MVGFEGTGLLSSSASPSSGSASSGSRQAAGTALSQCSATKNSLTSPCAIGRYVCRKAASCRAWRWSGVSVEIEAAGPVVAMARVGPGPDGTRTPTD